ncbi:TPA: putative DNA-binding transcriptional regulator [Klebsiella pneumoniae]|nr:putative DNA-binding transcriptional regulator [Klebsiella pneumoniae]HBQ1005390.1 putative DNA-binding transcriptional regulator [Klebsiella pneumoniae]HBQ1228532.1 putative DNA-binding transcriptional regulator [Klebsiella pneumoniae]HBU6409070.1 putative DNA-binding transcriptional regulator [Klebsiella pneumoniae]HBU6461991.1 putative DNA-binding transcriptional regulator [Klebsiella pneumoniae]
MLKERMTPEEIAHLTGYSRQTINKWVRKEGWQTSPRPGAQRVAETPGIYSPHDSDLESLLLTLSKELTPSEQKQLMSLLLREGITGLLLRLGIRDR